MEINNPLYFNYKGELKLVEQGHYNGHEYFIVSYGSHPCVYISIDTQSPFYYSHYGDICLLVHGGLSFKGTMFNMQCLGWNYNHDVDFSYSEVYPCRSGAIHTVEELRNAARIAIDDLIIEERKEKEKNNGVAEMESYISRVSGDNNYAKFGGNEHFKVYCRAMCYIKNHDMNHYIKLLTEEYERLKMEELK